VENRKVNIMPKTITLELKLKVTYLPNGVSENELRANLEQLVQAGIGEGLLTGESPAEVSSYSSCISRPGDPNFQEILTDLANSAETEGCDDCATISLETLNRARVALGWKELS
jgi:hypothetical protein